VEAVGVAGPPARVQALGLALAEATAATRLCPLGRMQSPPLGWHHGGRPRLGELLRWIDIERPVGGIADGDDQRDVGRRSGTAAARRNSKLDG
jgi:hypothetical protein